MATTTAIKPIQAQKNEVIIKPDDQVTMVGLWTQEFDKLTKTQAFSLTPEERNFGVALITGLVNICAKREIDTNQLDLTNFFEQTKHFAKQKLSFQEGEIYIDTRNNKNTGKIEVTVRRQYQGIMKLASRWIRSDMKIVDWKDAIVCEGDTFSYDYDYMTGSSILKYKEDPKVDHNNLNNITNAFAIAYIEINGKPRVPYICVIDKKRIMRAFNASSAKEKGPWTTDTARMVRKTAYWCLYNDELKHFVDIPSDVLTSIAATEDVMDFSTQDEQTADADNTAVYDIPTSDFSTEATAKEPQPSTEHEQSFADYLDEQDRKENEPVCSQCGKSISDKVAQYSMDKFSKQLCYDCQKVLR